MLKEKDNRSNIYIPLVYIYIYYIDIETKMSLFTYLTPTYYVKKNNLVLILMKDVTFISNNILNICFQTKF